MKQLITSIALLLCISASAADWNERTTDWSKNPKLVIGDWGFDRPGYPKGLYIHGVTVKEGKKVTNPVIYDNDVYDDVVEDEWMFAMASLKKMNLVGQIITPVYADSWQFYWKEWKQTAYDAMERAESSGIDMRRLPPITVGTEAENEKAGERKPSDGARLYVKLINEAYRKNRDKPLLINIGGQCATLASAYCIDPSIANKCIVYYTDILDYNGDYRWASELVAKNFRVVSWGGDNGWWKSKTCQNQWNVLPRPEHCEAADNDSLSGEWRLFSEMRNDMLDHIIHQFRFRKELCQEGWKADGYCDGTFIHAWLPTIFSDAEIRTIRGGKVLHIIRFTHEDEAEVKAFTMQTLLNKRAYKHKKRNKQL